MDYRLDFYNSINEFIEKMTDDDGLLVLTYNKENGDSIAVQCGDHTLLSMLLGNINTKDFINGNKDELERIKKSVVQMAFSIAQYDSKIKDALLEGLKKI